MRQRRRLLGGLSHGSKSINRLPMVLGNVMAAFDMRVAFFVSIDFFSLLNQNNFR